MSEGVFLNLLFRALLITSMTLATISPASAQLDWNQVFGGKVDEATCGYPKAEPNQKVLLISAAGNALSDVAVAGQDKVTETIEIEIQTGSEPLFIIAVSGDAMIWRFSGATDRVAKFIATSLHAAGATGLRANQVSFVPAGPCQLHLMAGEAAVRAALKSMTGVLGKSVDGIYYGSYASSIRLPSQAGATDKWRYGRRQTSQGFSWGSLKPANDNAAQLLRTSYPNGIVEIDPATVSTGGQAEKYTLLPKAAGLLQLIQSGAVVDDPALGYVVREYFPRFPAELMGVSFILAENVAKPGGNSERLSVRRYDETKQ